MPYRSEEAIEAEKRLTSNRVEQVEEIRLRLDLVFAHGKDLLDRTRDVNRQLLLNRKGPNSLEVSAELHEQFATLQAQAKANTQDQTLLTALLKRLRRLTQLHQTRNIPAYCEECQSPMWGDTILIATPTDCVWDTHQTLLFCPKCEK